jgi:hypothetical protein
MAMFAGTGEVDSAIKDPDLPTGGQSQTGRVMLAFSPQSPALLANTFSMMPACASRSSSLFGKFTPNDRTLTS